MRETRWTGLFSIALLTALLGPAGALAQGVPLELDFRAGPAFPAGDLADNADIGPGFDIGLNVGAWDRLAIRFEGGADLLPGVDIPGDGRNELDFNLVHFHAGPLLRVLEPGATPWSVEVNAGGGVTVLDIPKVGGAGQFGATVVNVSETYFSVVGGVGVGYEVNRTVSAFLHGQATVAFADEEDTAGLPALDPGLEALDTIVSIPLTGGVRVRF